MWGEFNDRHPGCGKDKHTGVPVERPLEREEKAGKMKCISSKARKTSLWNDSINSRGKK